jgi:hypothetical protein
MLRRLAARRLYRGLLRAGVAVEVVLFLHLLGALTFVAGLVVAGVAFEAARRRRDPAEIALLLGLTRVGVLLVGMGALAVLVFGLWLVHLEHIRMGAGWIVGALALYVVALGLGGAGGRRPKQARLLARRLLSCFVLVGGEMFGLFRFYGV